MGRVALICLIALFVLVVPGFCDAAEVAGNLQRHSTRRALHGYERTELLEWAQCGDKKGEWLGYCCPYGQYCTQQPGNVHYWQCAPPGHYGASKKDAGRRDSHTSAYSHCSQLPAWAQCGNEQGQYYGKCCPSGQHCTQQPGNKHYMQCVPPGHYKQLDAGRRKDTRHRNVAKRHDSYSKDSRTKHYGEADYECETVGQYAQCGETGAWEATCCTYGWECVSVGEGANYMQCRPWEPSTDPYEVRWWAQCGGKSLGEIQGVEPVDGEYPDYYCQAGSTCTKQTEWYWQCVADP